MRARPAYVLFVLFVVALPIVAASPDKPLMKNGTVVVRTGAGFVAVGIAPAGGGEVEHLFLFWPAKPIPASVKRFERGAVDFEPGRLRVSDAEQKNMLIYYVSDVTAPPTPEGFSSTSYAGKGLSHYVGGAASRLAISRSKEPDANLCYLDLPSCKDGVFRIFEPRD